MEERFDAAVRIILWLEGGYKPASPEDPGGETNFGISKRAHPQEDIADLTITRAIEIYHQHYWLQYACWRWPWPLCLWVFDAYVQHKPRTVTQHRLIPDTTDDVDDILLRRLIYYYERANDRLAARNFRGWIRRLIQIFTFSKYQSLQSTLDTLTINHEANRIDVGKLVVPYAET